MYALQTSCSDSLYLVEGPPLEWEDIPYIAPTYIIEILDKIRRYGLVVYHFFEGPMVPIYFRKDRIEKAKEIAEKEGVYTPSESLVTNPEFRGFAVATKLYRWLIDVAAKCGFEELGFAYHRHRVEDSAKDFAVLIIDGEVYTYGTKPSGIEEYSSSTASRDYASLQFVEIFNWLKNVLENRCRDLPEEPSELLRYLDMAKTYSK